MIITDKQKRNIILEYEEILLGKRKQFTNIDLKNTSTRNHEVLLEVFRYFFDDILCWSPETVERNLTNDLLKKYKLDKFYANCIIFDNEANGKARFVRKELVKADVMQLLKMIYKDRYHIDMYSMIVETYLDVVEGRLAKFPKNFFSASADGKLKACICLQHAIKMHNQFRNIQELYCVFADRNILKLLDIWHLRDVAEQYYDTPIEFLHDALPKDQREEYEEIYDAYYEKYQEVLETTGRSF